MKILVPIHPNRGRYSLLVPTTDKRRRNVSVQKIANISLISARIKARFGAFDAPDPPPADERIKNLVPILADRGCYSVLVPTTDKRRRNASVQKIANISLNRARFKARLGAFDAPDPPTTDERKKKFSSNIC